MPRNIEVKARLENVAAMMPIVASIADEGPIEIQQDDTFFGCERGRIKLREFSETSGELIFYQRANQAGPKQSSYIISPTAAPGTLREALTMAYGQSGRVRKHRTLFLVGRTRVHLDRVEDLGHFLELEVVLLDNESADQGAHEAQRIMKSLGIAPTQLVEGAYVDLITRTRS